MKKSIAVLAAVIFVMASTVNSHAAAFHEKMEGGGMPCMEQVTQHKYYSVNGATLDFDMQDYIYDMLSLYDMQWYYPTFLCQVYQESRYDQNLKNYHADGTVDVGLCQLKDKYHAELISLAGLGPRADVYSNPYDNLTCGMALMHRNWTECWDINTAISAYFTGNVNQYDPTYVQDVRKWEYTLMEVDDGR